jgi:hypothetical protein
MTLNSWQELLAGYFRGLRQRLSATGNRRPLFALEHDLDSSRLAELVRELKIYTDQTGPAERHWAVWSVYATEIGYRFRGEEYWQTFAEDLPGWARNEDRDFIRDALFRFHKEFEGPVPSGNWAKNFTIICWPITNAILPKDLQRHLASTLYDIRNSFTPELLAKPEDLGRLIGENSDRSSSRFRRFAKEHELVGRIALALLRPEGEDANDLLEPHTLKRITQDLLAVHNARLWLQAARQRASTATMHGVRIKPSTPTTGTPSEPETGSTIGVSDEERLELTARRTGEDSWSIRAVLPNLSHLRRYNSAFQQTFASQRSYIEVSDKSHFAPRAFTIKRQEVRLKAWPAPHKSIVRFDSSQPGLESMLDTYCSIDGECDHLFRLREDSNAILIRSRTLRPDSQYLFVSTHPFPQSTILQGSKRVSVACEGLDALYIDVPEYVNSFYVDAARSLGLEVQAGIEIAPVGYPANIWNGDGEASWNRSSPKILAISTSIEVSTLQFHIAGNNLAQRLESPIHGRGPLFLDLGELAHGSYQLQVTAQVPSSSTGRVAGSLDIEVVADNDQVLTRESAQGFQVVTSPTLPTLEELWSGSTKIEVYGPLGAQVSVRVKFYSDVDAKKADFEFPLGKLTLPIDETQWESLFRRVRENKPVQSAYERAVSCLVLFRSIDLGESTLECEREFVPFRWSIRSKSSSQTITLLRNDSAAHIALLRSGFTQPNCFEPLSLDAKGESEERGPGGLVVARTASSLAALILPPTTMRGLASLSAVVTRIAPALNAPALVRLSDSHMLWNDAEMLGDPISRMKRNAAIESLKTAIIESVCGAPWLSWESDVEHGRKTLCALSSMVTRALPLRFQHELANAFCHAHTLSDEEMAFVALDMAKMARLVRDQEIEIAAFLTSIRSFVRILRAGENSFGSVPSLNEEAAQIALKNQNLMQFVRVLQLLAREKTPSNRALGTNP